MKPGTLLSPNDYLRRNKRAHMFGIVLEVRDDLFGKSVRVFFNNNITKWLNEDQIRELFEVSDEV